MSGVSIIGSGFAGLASACFMARNGHKVTLLEKNSSVGGRARMYQQSGFKFDMGPSWYWMPDVFERFFSAFGKNVSDYYDLQRLDPGFQVIFGKNDTVAIPARLEDIHEVFESIEKGASEKLKKFMAEAGLKYRIGMGEMVYKPAHSWMEYATWPVVSNAMKLQMFTSMRSHVRSYFKDERLRAIMEFPVLFLGSTASRIPALYSLMNYSAFAQGTWYPNKGMLEIVSAMEQLAVELGVDIRTGVAATGIAVHNNMAAGIETATGFVPAKGVIATGDYHHIEQKLLEARYRNYPEDYWTNKVMAPSCLIFYLGVSKKIEKLIHHNLFFDASLDQHAAEIYDNPKWPVHPLFYVCCPSKTDHTVAPYGMENLFLLMPIAPGLTDTPEIREQYFSQIMQRLEEWCGTQITPYIVHKRAYCIEDFKTDYNAYRGNAYGLANTLRQTAVLKPALRNKKIKNLFYAGQLTVPGPGVPPALVSGELAANQLTHYLKTVYETVV
jgi:phytoene desaturase